MRRILLFLGLLAAALSAPIAARADHAADLRAILAKIRLPPGFHISLYALAPQARGLAVSPDGRAIIVGTRGDKVYKIKVDGASPPKATIFAPKLKFVLPSGPCFAPDGTLFISEFDRIRKFARLSGGGWDASHPQDVVAQGKLVPPSVISHGHGLRVCRIGPDGKLYVAIGQPYNVPPKNLWPTFNKLGVGAIVRMNQDGTDRQVFAHGIRNSVGMDFSPEGVLWFTDNQVDMMGEDIPPEELNKAAKPGENFGFPYYGGGHVRTREYAHETPPAGLVFPEVELDAHAADLGMIFYRGKKFPEKWRGIFIAQHGSWNRKVPIGARIVFVPYHDGKAGAEIPFAQGWNPGRTPYLGRPAALAELPDGSLLVSDDQEGALYRIAYDGK